ncbi:MAG: HepT-like ribonuclease domain-containing protein [Candidatus Ratteibacteria bacterium]|nr:HepT-like ribonuclease domain-containing protein [Candidatus Ratteibacteria bacterium]
MLHELKKYLYDIQQAIEKIESFLKNKTYAHFVKESLLQSAVERQFEIIGEALYRIKRVDEKFLSKITDSYKIIGFRNVITHGYDILDSRIIWDAIKFNLPKLKSEISSLINI